MFLNLIMVLAVSISATNIPTRQFSAFIQKCCERTEIMVDNKCRTVNETSEWTPIFQNENGQEVSPKYYMQFGLPSCGNRQIWPIYHELWDRLALLPDGTLRHYARHIPPSDHDLIDEEINDKFVHYDYTLGFYCRDKKLDSSTNTFSEYAIVCAPEVTSDWNDMDIVLRKVVDPICHIIAIICYVTIAIIHFVLPQLRDMVGNIITTMCICLLVAQATDLCRIYTEYTSPIGFLITDIIMFISLVGAHFWLNTLGFYIWKTFRSRNVFLRITDGRKYCYYSYWVWAWTIAISVLALFAHFVLDIDAKKPQIESKPVTTAIGWLGIGVFFLPISCTILCNIYFYSSTLQVMSKLASYGRIHHKLKYCFETFLKIFLVMAVSWLFLLLSWLPFSSIYYSYILTNALEAPLLLYISVFSQRRVRFLLRKVCCFEKCICSCLRPNQPNDAPEWGEEMMAMTR